MIQLSGCELQRVAIAIALANKLKILLADEPTGSVDSKTTELILDIFRKLNKKLGIIILIVTHALGISRKVDRIVTIRDGIVSSEFIHKRFYKNELAGLFGNSLSDEADSYIEMVVLDKTGRLKLPKDLAEELTASGIDKLPVTKEDKKIVLTKPEKK